MWFHFFWFGVDASRCWVSDDSMLPRSCVNLIFTCPLRANGPAYRHEDNSRVLAGVKRVGRGLFFPPLAAR